MAGSPIFARVEWFLFVTMNVRALVFDLPRLDNFDTTESLGSCGDALLAK